MRLFIPARRHILESLQRPLHGGSALCSHYGCINALTSMGCCSKPMKLPSYSYKVHFSTFSSRHSEGSNSSNGHQNDNKKMDLEIVSRETIKPASPTPHHLRTYNLSLLDQWMFDVYSPLALFIPNTDKASVYDVVTKRSKHLKESLSHILTQFYPIAGEVKDNLYIECNDKGVYYIEARVNQTLEDFLFQPDDEMVRELNPGTPRNTESSIGNYVIGIQVNIFNCGGIGLSTSLSHKIIDGHTHFLFMKAWAAAARGAQISPCFVASEVFPNDPCLKHYNAPSKLVTTKKLITKRFVFDSTALALLKAQPVASSSHGPTRMEATTALIWKAAATAAYHVRTFSPQSPHALLSAVNLRRRASQLLPNESIGNLVASACAVCYPESQPDLSTLIYAIRQSIAKINYDHIESLKGENGYKTMDVMLRELNHLTDVTQEGDVLFVTSLLNSGMYEWDFGWGKPIWFYDMNAGFTRFLSLNDTVKGGGVEATVTLSPDEMEIFESDRELLSYVKVEPSPLQYVKDA